MSLTWMTAAAWLAHCCRHRRHSVVAAHLGVGPPHPAAGAAAAPCRMGRGRGAGGRGPQLGPGLARPGLGRVAFDAAPDEVAEVVVELARAPDPGASLNPECRSPRQPARPEMSA